MNNLKLKDIVVIDDNSEDLEAIVKALRKANQFVISFLYNNDHESPTMNMLRSCSKSEKIIRCIITDINLVEGSTYDPQNAAKHLADNVLGEFITSETKSYILFVWTSKDNETEFNKFKETLNDTLQKNGIKQPLNIVKISKNECKNGETYDSDKIMSFIENAMTDDANKAILQLIDWEKKCEMATAETIETLINFENTSHVLYKLLRELGGKNALNEPEQIVNILLLLLKDNLNKLASGKNIRTLWEDLFKNIDEKLELNNEEKAQINAILHIDRNLQHSDIICPGDFFELCDSNILNYCFFSAMNNSPKDFYFDKCFILNPNLSNELKAKKNEKKKEILNSFKMGLLEISAECDFAQNKKVSNLYVLSFMVPKIEEYEFIRYLNNKKNEDKRTGVPASISDPLLIEYGNMLYYLFIDAKYIFSLNSNFINAKYDLNHKRLEKIFRLRESYLQNWIQFVANYNSRIGTISLK